MTITDSRARDILHWLDDKAGDHTVLFEAMTAHRDTAALIRQLQAEVQDAWQAGLDAGREQGRGNEHCRAEPQPAGVVRMYSGLLYARLDGDFPVGTKLYAHQPPSAPVGVEE